MSKFDPVFAVRLDSFLRVKTFSPKSSARPNLDGICVQPAKGGGAVCMATDGHRLGMRWDEEGLAERRVAVKIPAALKMPRKPKRYECPRSPWMVAAVEDGVLFTCVVPPLKGPKEGDTPASAFARIFEAETRWYNAELVGEYPDVFRVVPKAVPEKYTVSFNASLIESFGRVLAISGNGSAEPHLVMDADDKDFVGVVMPMRHEGRGIPDWATTPA